MAALFVNSGQLVSITCPAVRQGKQGIMKFNQKHSEVYYEDVDKFKKRNREKERATNSFFGAAITKWGLRLRHPIGNCHVSFNLTKPLMEIIVSRYCISAMH